jgi:hypothetical protein
MAAGILIFALEDNFTRVQICLCPLTCILNPLYSILGTKYRLETEQTSCNNNYYTKNS